MKNYYRFLLLGFLFGLFSMAANAQAKLGMTTTSVSSSTPGLGDQLYIFTVLKNYSLTDTFNSAIYFNLANKDSIITNSTIVGKPPYTGTVIKLAPGEEKSALFTVQLLPSYFAVGPDIIIVWPITKVPDIDTGIVDSAWVPIFINGSTGINEKPDSKLRIFVFGDQLFIKNEDSESRLQRVQIYSMEGTLVKSADSLYADMIVPLNNLPQGTYIAEVVWADGRKQAIKFMR